jgi:hypothetical protein
MATDGPPTTAEVERRVVALVRERLPKTWRVGEASQSQGRFDLGLEIEGPDKQAAQLVIEVKQVIERRDVARIADEAMALADDADVVPVVAARYLSASVRDALADARISYVDATGNMRIVIDCPTVFISDRGEDRDPWRKGRPRGTLKGEPAARVTRALLDFDREWTVRELVAASGSSIGAAYRVLDYLEREDLVVKDDKRYRVTDWERLLRVWSADAAFQDTTRVMAFIEPRGVDAFLNKVAKRSNLSAAVTGSTAATQWARYAPSKATYVYVSSIQEASEQWGLRPNAAAPNVILLEPRTVGDVPFQNIETAEAGYPIAAPAQVAADLLNGPGREPAEGEYLIEWMKANEKKWRRD